MSRLVFAISLIVISWLGMMIAHELGHVLGAIATGARVTRVVLHPLEISRTDVTGNACPGVVVWLGPLIGCLLPLAASCTLHWCGRSAVLKKSAMFFAGFCLLANGAYIAGGSWDGVGDCGEMLRCGTPVWVMVLFGVSAMLTGLVVWHRLGSPATFLRADLIVPRDAGLVTGIAVGLVMVLLALSALQ